jgi:hypothetical protein
MVEVIANKVTSLKKNRMSSQAPTAELYLIDKFKAMAEISEVTVIGLMGTAGQSYITLSF